MATLIKTMEDKDGNTILPRTRTSAITMGDGTTSLDEALSELEQAQAAHEAYSTYKLNLDDNGIFAEIQYKRPNGTLILKSVLSGGTSPQYTSRTETEYEQDGTTVRVIRIYAIAYADGKVVSEVLQ